VDSHAFSNLRWDSARNANRSCATSYQGFEGLARPELGLQDGVVAVPELVEEGAQDLLEHRLLGVEVVVEAAGEHAGMVRDLAYGGGVVALLGEHLGGGAEEFAAALGSSGHLGLLLGRHGSIVIRPAVRDAGC
jgi:hypothetical protein